MQDTYSVQVTGRDGETATLMLGFGSHELGIIEIPDGPHVDSLVRAVINCWPGADGRRLTVEEVAR